MAKGKTRRRTTEYATKEQRLRILTRDDWSCQTCGRALQNDDKSAQDYAHAGHIVGVWEGGDTSDDNLMAQCAGCNVADGSSVGGHLKAQAHKQATARVAELEAEVARLRGLIDLDAFNEDRKDLALNKVNTPRNQRRRKLKQIDAFVEAQEKNREAAQDPHVFDTQGVTPTHTVSADFPQPPPVASGSANLASVCSPGPGDGCWDVPWLKDLKSPPEGAVWPRVMSRPHPAAIGSYGHDFERYVQALPVFGEDHRLRWWQRLAARRLLEHDEAGELVWSQAVITLARQVGKSWLLADLALWRIGAGHFPGRQQVVSFGNQLSTVERIQEPAREFALLSDGWKPREVNGNKAVMCESTHSQWRTVSLKGVYGTSSDLALGDEAWALPEQVISEGVEPTLVERDNSQLVLTSTAHRACKPLMRGRRRELLLELASPSKPDPAGLLLEWSADEGDPLDDPATWRKASPHWSDRRELMVRRAWDRVRSGVTVDADEPDPIESFKAQWLNIWPEPTEAPAPEDPGEPLLEPEAWDALQIPPPDLGTGSIVFGLEDYFGKGAAAAIALALPNGALFVDGLLFPTAWDAVQWVRDYLNLFARGGATIACGASLAKDAAVKTLPANVVPMTTADTPSALHRFRNLAGTGQLVHDGCEDLAAQLETIRVTEAGHGTAARVVSKTRTDLLRATAWAVLTHQRESTGGVTAW